MNNAILRYSLFIIGLSCFINLEINSPLGRITFYGANMFSFVLWCCIVFVLLKITQRCKLIIEEKFNTAIMFKYDFLLIFFPFLLFFHKTELTTVSLNNNITIGFGNMMTSELTITILLTTVILLRILSILFAVPFKDNGASHCNGAPIKNSSVPIKNGKSENE